MFDVNHQLKWGKKKVTQKDGVFPAKELIKINAHHGEKNNNECLSLAIVANYLLYRSISVLVSVADEVLFAYAMSV